MRRLLFFTALASCVGVAASASAAPGNRIPSCPPITYHSATKLHAQRLCMNLGITTHGTEPGTYLFMTPGGAFGTGAGIFADDGTLVWWQRAASPMEEDMSVVHYRHHAYLAVWSGKATFDGPYGMGTVSLYNEHYQRVGRITSGAPFAPNRIDAHEFRITPQGDALFGIYDPVGAKFHGRRVEVYRYVVQKVSLVRGRHGIRTGRVLFHWDSLKHVPLSESHASAPTDHTVWDYFHGNTISQESDGNLLVSGRNTWGMYEINSHTGHIVWQVGAPGDHTLKEPWAFQHDVVPLGHDQYSLFDDGGASAGCRSPGTHPSRGLIVQVDPTQSDAGVRLLRSYSHLQPICSGCCGSMQVVRQGDVLVDWGKTREVTEYRRSGGVPVMDLSMSRWSYRGLRFPWHGLPLSKPAVAAARSGTSTNVWASWNGSTEVKAWRVLAGAKASRLSRVGSSWPKEFFETEIALPRRYKVVAVQALDASGHVLSTSKPVAAAG